MSCTLGCMGCMSFLEYMGFVLVVFPLKCGFIMVLMHIHYTAVHMSYSAYTLYQEWIKKSTQLRGRASPTV